jgi:inosine-uridine nucleoside N-ribohydrolase
MARTVTSRRVVGPGLALTASLVLAVAGCGTPPATPIPGTPEPATVSIPVIIDADFDMSDLAAMAVLLRDPQVDVQAIAIDGTGLVHCQAGRLMARYLLDQLGSPDIPFGCGRADAGPDAHPFPDEWRATADAAFGLDIVPTAEPATPRNAVTVIKDAVAHSPSAPTIVALGPLTNLEDAFAADPTLADRVAGIHAMLGTIRAPGNVLVDDHTAADQLEWNAFADPSAVAAVFDTDVPIALVPLDATDDVPVPADLPDRLVNVHAAGADFVHELLVRNPSRMDANAGQQLWDELAALALTNQDLVDWADATVTVDPHGRIAEDDAGRSVRYAGSADRATVEDALVEALGRGAPRTAPFELSGTIGVTFDGSDCVATGHSDRDGPHRLDFKASTGKPAGVVMVGTIEPHTWQEVVDLSHTFDAQASPPDWLVLGPMAQDTIGDGKVVTATGSLSEGFYGPICISGAFPNATFVAGTPFEVGAGPIGS